MALAMIDADVFLGDVLLPLVAALVLGGVIGLEREFHGRAAGLRTHIMVCLGTTMAMVVPMQLYHILPTDSSLRVDPGRMAAGIMTGIGFIGAGAVMNRRSATRGLTTAACIWFVAALGIVVGVKAYALAAAGTLLALGVLMLLAQFEHHLRPDTYREILLVAKCSEGLLDRAGAVIAELGMAVQSQEFEEEIEKGQVRAVFRVRFRRAHLGEEALRRLRELPGVKTIGWRMVAT